MKGRKGRKERNSRDVDATLYSLAANSSRHQTRIPKYLSVEPALGSLQSLAFDVDIIAWSSRWVARKVLETLRNSVMKEYFERSCVRSSFHPRCLCCDGFHIVVLIRFQGCRAHEADSSSSSETSSTSSSSSSSEGE